MNKIKEYIRNVLKKIIKWVFHDENIKFDTFIAMDVSAYNKEQGKIVIVTRVNKENIVKILDIPYGMEMNDYKNMLEYLTRFTKDIRIDCSYQMRPFFNDMARRFNFDDKR
jgi:hypothetical protein